MAACIQMKRAPLAPGRPSGSRWCLIEAWLPFNIGTRVGNQTNAGGVGARGVGAGGGGYVSCVVCVLCAW